MRAIWTFLWTERLGYHRESPLTAHDRYMREQADTRLDRLHDRLMVLLDEQDGLFRRNHER